MSTRNISRQASKVKHFNELDLLSTVIREDMLDTKETTDCFGHWDLRDKSCSVCADNEVCGIVTAERLQKKAKEMEKIEKYLDVSELDVLDKEVIKVWLAIKERTVDELVDKVMAESKNYDETAVIEWIKRFIKGDDELYTKDGIVKLR